MFKGTGGQVIADQQVSGSNPGVPLPYLSPTPMCTCRDLSSIFTLITKCPKPMQKQCGADVGFIAQMSQDQFDKTWLCHAMIGPVILQKSPFILGATPGKRIKSTTIRFRNQTSSPFGQMPCPCVIRRDLKDEVLDKDLHMGVHDCASEWPRKWTTNPLGSTPKGSNPFAVTWGFLFQRFNPQSSDQWYNFYCFCFSMRFLIECTLDIHEKFSKTTWIGAGVPTTKKRHCKELLASGQLFKEWWCPRWSVGLVKQNGVPFKRFAVKG